MIKIIKKFTFGLVIITLVSMNINQCVFAATDNNVEAAKNSIYENLKNFETRFSIDYVGDNVLDMVNDVAKKDDYLNILINDFDFKAEDGYSIINVKYNTTSDQENFVSNKSTEIVNSIITSNMSDVDKVKAINEYLINSFDFDNNKNAKNAYLALNQKKAPSQGYAMTASKLFTEAGIENKIVIGVLNSKEYAWNLVKINGQWYNLNIAKNDSTGDKNKFFLKSDAYLINEGFVWNSKEYPKCPSNYELSEKTSVNSNAEVQNTNKENNIENNKSKEISIDSDNNKTAKEEPKTEDDTSAKEVSNSNNQKNDLTEEVSNDVDSKNDTNIKDSVDSNAKDNTNTDKENLDVNAWYEKDNSWYFRNTSGENSTGWIEVKGSWYYLGTDGKMKTGWVEANGKWYYLDSNGKMQTGWKEISGKWYYFLSSGEMAAHTVVNGYLLNSNGVLIK